MRIQLEREFLIRKSELNLRVDSLGLYLFYSLFIFLKRATDSKSTVIGGVRAKTETKLPKKKVRRISPLHSCNFPVLTFPCMNIKVGVSGNGVNKAVVGKIYPPRKEERTKLQSSTLSKVKKAAVTPEKPSGTPKITIPNPFHLSTDVSLDMFFDYGIDFHFRFCSSNVGKCGNIKLTGNGRMRNVYVSFMHNPFLLPLTPHRYCFCTFWLVRDTSIYLMRYVVNRKYQSQQLNLQLSLNHSTSLVSGGTKKQRRKSRRKKQP